jgi:hypothetical protein
MELAVDGFEPGGIDVRVDLRCGDAGVAEHFLEAAEVRAASEHVRGEAVPK